MNNYFAAIAGFIVREKGVTSIEYALIGALIAVVCVVSVTATGSNVNNLWTIVCNEVSTAISGAPAC